MTALYATPRKARIISTGEVVHIHGYGQGAGGAIIAIIERVNGDLDAAHILTLQLDAPTAPQLGRSEQEQP